MSAIVIHYDSLTQLANCSKRCAEQAQDYANNLSRKIASKLGAVPGGSSGNLNSANYYISKKIEQLNKKANTFQEYSKKVEKLSETAKRVDRDVKNAIARNKDEFLNNHKDLKQPIWKVWLIEFLVNVKNSNPLFQAIGNLVNKVGETLSNVRDNIRYWYECEGGKQIVKIVTSIATAICTIAIFIATMPASFSITAIAGVIGGMIGVTNALVSVISSVQSHEAFKNGDRAGSKIYGDRDSLTDVIRETNFGSAELNNFFDKTAATIDIVDQVCGVIGTIETITKISSKVNCIKNYFSENGGLRGYLKEPVWKPQKVTSPTGELTTVMKMAVDENGVVKMHYTPRSIFRGIRYFISDSKVTKNGSKVLQHGGKMIEVKEGIGLRTELRNNFKLDVQDAINTFKQPIGNQIKDGIRYAKENSRTLSVIKGAFSSDGKTIVKGKLAMKSFMNDYNVFSPSDAKDFASKLKNVKRIWDKGFQFANNWMEKKPFTIQNITTPAIENILGTFAVTQLGEQIGVHKKIASSLNINTSIFKGGIIEQAEGMGDNLKVLLKNNYGLKDRWGVQPINIPEIHIPDASNIRKIPNMIARKIPIKIITPYRRIFPPILPRPIIVPPSLNYYF